MANFFDQFDEPPASGNFFDQFDDRAQPSPAATQPDADVGYDMLRSIGTGLRSGAESLVGGIGDAGQMTGDAAAWLAKQAGAGEGTQETLRSAGRWLMPGAAMAPTTEQIRSVTSQAVGEHYQPQTIAGEYGRTLGEFAPAAVAGPGGVLRKTAQAVIPALASETAGQATKGTQYEGVARLAGSLAGSGVAGYGTKRSAINKAAAQAPSREQIKSETDNLYDFMRKAGVKYDANEFQSMTAQLGNRLVDDGIMQADAPKTYARINQLYEWARSGKSPEWREIESMRRGLGKIMRDADSTERNAASKVFGVISQFEKNAPAINTAGLSAQQLASLRARARDMALRDIKADRLSEIAKDSETYISGIESGLKNKAASTLRSKSGKRLFNETEQDAIMDVAGGSPVRNILSTAGRAGFDVSRLGNISTLAPMIAGGGAALYSQDPTIAALVMGAGTAAKYGARTMAQRDMQRALAIARMGPRAQRQIPANISRDRLRAGIAAGIAANQSQPLELTVAPTTPQEMRRLEGLLGR